MLDAAQSEDDRGGGCGPKMGFAGHTMLIPQPGGSLTWISSFGYNGSPSSPNKSIAFFSVFSPVRRSNEPRDSELTLNSGFASPVLAEDSWFAFGRR